MTEKKEKIDDEPILIPTPFFTDEITPEQSKMISACLIGNRIRREKFPELCPHQYEIPHGLVKESDLD